MLKFGGDGGTHELKPSRVQNGLRVSYVNSDLGLYMSLDRSVLSQVDAVVMLTWSNWFTELRSNRYHYAVRFARVLPVIFVQPDIHEATFRFEETDIPNITVLHLPTQYDTDQLELFNQALLHFNIIKPMLWVYNVNFENIICNRYSALNVYHGTEDYLTSESRIKIKDQKLLNAFHRVLKECELLVAVSDGVRESFQSCGMFQGQAITINNGCDYKFYSPIENNHQLVGPKEKTVFYQGNIFDKLDFELLYELAKRLATWRFHLCGKVVHKEPGWVKLLTLPNVTYLGLCSPEEIREHAYQSTVGVIPFVQNEWLIERSFPLKTFEYLACGLPVVTIPIKGLLPYANVLTFATTVDEFETAILHAEALRTDAEHTRMRLHAAALQDYDLKFEEVARNIDRHLSQTVTQLLPLHIAILYEPWSVKVNTIKEHLDGFCAFSRHHVSYLPATQDLDCNVNLNVFDVIVIHYSVRVSVPSGHFMLSPHYIDAVKKFGGYKVLFLQDEYEGTETARTWISTLGIHAVYTCVPKQYIETIYPKNRFPFVAFVNTLTGYIPMKQPHLSIRKKPSERHILIGYRGRALPYWYGSLGQEKLNIGVKVKEYAIKNGIEVDIEWDDSKRIYGQAWYEFLGRCRATLGTESGSNIFDDNGRIRAAIEQKLQENPELSYDDIFDEYIAPNEIIKMNQISPKIFESIVLGTALILFEGDYSGILIPDIHYIPLRKDFSNIEDVMTKLKDDGYIEQITAQAYQDVVASNQYSYQTFVHEFDHFLMSVKKRNPMKNIIFSFIGSSDGQNISIHSGPSNKATLPSKTVFTLNEINSLNFSMKKYIVQSFRQWIVSLGQWSRGNIPALLKKLIRISIPKKLKQKIRLIVDNV